MSRYNDPADYALYRSQTACLAAILRYVSRDGYGWYLVTTTPTDRALAAVQKLDEKYYVLISAEARRVRREAGLPVAQLVLAARPEGGVWPYALLATERLPREGMERASRAARPLTWPAFRGGAWRPTYELRKDEQARWTWYLTEAFYRELLEEALHYAEKGDWPKLVGHFKTLGNLPMYRGVWTQVQDIRRRMQRLWGDRHLRNPDGQWKVPPWRKALEDWPQRPISPVRVYLYVRPEVDGERPRTLGEWVRQA